MARYVLEVLKEYDIIRNLGYFIMDNALDNDTIMITLSHSLHRDFGLKYNLIHYRIRY
jgi:phosphoglucomutase